MTVNAHNTELINTDTLLESSMHICTRCAEKYDWKNMTPPPNATSNWVPTCPACHADVTATTVDKTWLDIIGSNIEKDANPDFEYDYERQRKRVHYHARLYHGRLAGLSVEEIIERARWFDSHVTHERYIGPQGNRDVAFKLRRQAQHMATD